MTFYSEFCYFESFENLNLNFQSERYFDRLIIRVSDIYNFVIMQDVP